MMRGQLGQAGFSLVEVMCAILVLGIALAGLTRGISLALLSNKESELQTNGALIAAGLIETLRAEGTLVDGSTGGECETIPLYRWTQVISKTEIDGLHQVEVSVKNSKSGKMIYELQTLLFELPEDSAAGPDKRRESAGKRRERRPR
jgi:prepilin-type N-terminal cleavage/methylation domain-containing protein